MSDPSLLQLANVPLGTESTIVFLGAETEPPSARIRTQHHRLRSNFTTLVPASPQYECITSEHHERLVSWHGFYSTLAGGASCTLASG